MSEDKTLTTGAAVMHIDLRLVPLSKQVNLIWLSRVIKTSAELQEKTGLNEYYIKYILNNKSKILKSWRETLQTTKKVNTNEKDDHDALDILLLEWIRCCTLNKIVLYRYAIEMQANNLKDFFELPKYCIRDDLWQDINLIKEYNMEYVQTRADQQIPYDLYTIFKKNGAKLLKLQTYVRFSLLMKRKSDTDCINLLKKTFVEKKSSNDNNSSEQFDDLILIEKPIECIDVTVEEDKLKRETLSPLSNAEISNHTITTYNTDETSNDFTTSIEPDISIKKEPCESVDADAEALMEYQQIQIKSEGIENDDITNKSNQNVESDKNTNEPNDEENDYKFDMDIGEEFILTTDPKSIGILNAESEEIATSIKKELENENHTEEIKKKTQKFAKLKVENTKNLKMLENTKTDNGNSRVTRHQLAKISMAKNKVKINSKISKNLTQNVNPEPISKDSNDSGIFLTTRIKTEPETVKRSEKLLEMSLPNNKLVQKEPPEFINNSNNKGDNADNDDDVEDANSEIEVIYEIEDSDEDMQNELQQIINNYRQKDGNKQKDKEKADKEDEQSPQQQMDFEDSQDNHDNEDETITVLEVISENEDNDEEDYNDNDHITNNLPAIAVSLNNEKSSEKRKHFETSSDNEETFNPNLPSTSRVAAAAAAANIGSTKSSASLSKSSAKAHVKKTPRLDLSSKEKEASSEIKIENNTDAIKYLQHIKNYLLSQNDEVGVKLLLNLQLAFINFD